MKLIRGLFMLLIGMIGFTAMASTPLTEQKQKIEIVKDLHVLTAVENVQITDFAFATVKVNQEVTQSGDYKQIISESYNPSAIVTDVGWRRQYQFYKKTPYTEKLLENYNLLFRNSLRIIKVNQIRENPFITKTIYIKNRHC